jgi:hypothetical protein
VHTASVRLFPSDLVVTGETGGERWLPRYGPNGVTTLAEVTADGRLSRVELRTADGRPRAVLPWASWFAGAGGTEALASFAAAAGLPVLRTEGPHISDSLETIWPYRPLQAPAAGSYPDWPGLPGQASFAIPLTYGILTAIIGAGSLPAVAVALGAVLASVSPWFARRVTRTRLGHQVRA